VLIAFSIFKNFQWHLNHCQCLFRMNQTLKESLLRNYFCYISVKLLNQLLCLWEVYFKFVLLKRKTFFNLTNKLKLFSFFRLKVLFQNASLKQNNLHSFFLLLFPRVICSTNFCQLISSKLLLEEKFSESSVYWFTKQA
jgi:hypothetical protein